MKTIQKQLLYLIAGILLVLCYHSVYGFNHLFPQSTSHPTGLHYNGYRYTNAVPLLDVEHPHDSSQRTVSLSLQPLSVSMASMLSQPTTSICPSCPMTYLLTVKPHLVGTQQDYIQHLNTIIAPYQVISHIDDATYILSGPMNPIYEQFIVPASQALEQFDVQNDDEANQHTTNPEVSDIPRIQPKSAHAINLLSLSETQLRAMFSIPSTPDQLDQLVAEIGRESIDQLYHRITTLFNYFSLISGKVDGVQGLSHYQSNMKLSPAFQQRIEQFIHIHQRRGNHQHQLFDLSECVASLMNQRIDDVNQMYHSQHHGHFQIETDGHLDRVDGIHPHHPTADDETVSHWQNVIEVLADGGHGASHLSSVTLRSEDENGVQLALPDFDYEECIEQQEELLHPKPLEFVVELFDFTLDFLKEHSETNYLQTIVDHIFLHDACEQAFEPLSADELDRPPTSGDAAPTTTEARLMLHLTTHDTSTAAQSHVLSNALPLCLTHIQSIQQVALIHTTPHVKLMNQKAKLLLQDRRLLTNRLLNRGITGRGQIVIVGDTGVDHDHCMFYDEQNPSTKHIGKLQAVSADFTQRKIILYATDFGDTHDDSGGHGTHVAATIAGSAMDLQKLDQVASLYPYNGHARDAKLIVIDFKRVGVNELNVPTDLGKSIFKPLTTKYDVGISSHSWGGETAYNKYSQNVDDFVYNNPFHLPVFAAGNDGEKGYHTILSPGNAKNVLTVGAAANLDDLPGASVYIKTNPKDDDGTLPFSKLTFPYVNSEYTRRLDMSITGEIPVIIADPIEACSVLDNAKDAKNAMVIVRRGTCSFVTKSNIVYQAGAKGVLVVNNNPTAPIVMGVDNARPSFGAFAAAMIAKSYGEDIIQYYTDNASKEGFLPLVFATAGKFPGGSYSYTMADFSSRGPTLDGRVKPDIVAPGRAIYSAKSDGSVKGPNCLHANSGGLMVMSGTSMATPAVSGNVAMLKQYFEEGYYTRYNRELKWYIKPPPDDEQREIERQKPPTPLQQLRNTYRLSAAGLKSIIINSGQSNGGSVNTKSIGTVNISPSPMSIYQGWGMMNLDRILMFEDQFSATSVFDQPPAAYQDLTEEPELPSRLYVFDSIAEDVITAQFIAYYHPTQDEEDKEKDPILPLQKKIQGLLDNIGITQDDTNALYRKDGIQEILLDKALVKPDDNIMVNPTSFFLSTDNEALDYFRCASSSKPDAVMTCGLTSHSFHTHCFTVSTEDITRVVEQSIARGGRPVPETTKDVLKSLVVQGKTISNVAQLQTFSKSFETPLGPFTTHPLLSRATLTWTDVPGKLATERVLIHDLDAIMTVNMDLTLYITPTTIGIVNSKNQVEKTIAIDWPKYRKYFPLFFDVTDAILEEQGIHMNQPTTAFVGQVFPIKQLVTYGNSINLTNNGRGDEIPATQNPPQVVDIINNVEQVEFNTRSINMNAYLLIAAIHLNRHFSMTVGVRVGQLSNKLAQHYSIAVTGAFPGSISPPTPQNTQGFHTPMMEAQSLDMDRSPLLNTPDLSPQQATYGKCGSDINELFCPNKCSNNGKCIDGKCQCQTQTQFHPLYNTTVAVQYTGEDCSIPSELLETFCKAAFRQKDTMPPDEYIDQLVRCKPTDRYSTPVIAPVERVIEPFQWHYYSIPRDIINFATKLSVTNSTTPREDDEADDQSVPQRAQSSTLSSLSQHEQNNSPGIIASLVQLVKTTMQYIRAAPTPLQKDDKDTDKDDTPPEPESLPEKSLYIGISFTPSAVNKSQPRIMGDPDLYVSSDSIPTLNNYQFANRNCDTCVKKVNGFSYSSSHLTTNIEHNEDEQQQQQPISSPQLYKGLARELDSLRQSLSPSSQATPSVWESMSLSALSLFSTPDDDTMLTKQVPLDSLPQELLDDKDTLWIDGTYFDKAPNKLVTVGIYGYCCHPTSYSISVHAIHLKDYRTPQTPTDVAVFISLFTIAIILCCSLVVILFFGHYFSLFTKCFHANEIDPNAPSQQPPGEGDSTNQRGTLGLISTALCCDKLVFVLSYLFCCRYCCYKRDGYRRDMVDGDEDDDEDDLIAFSEDPSSSSNRKSSKKKVLKRRKKQRQPESALELQDLDALGTHDPDVSSTVHVIKPVPHAVSSSSRQADSYDETGEIYVIEQSPSPGQHEQPSRSGYTPYDAQGQRNESAVPMQHAAAAANAETPTYHATSQPSVQPPMPPTAASVPQSQSLSSQAILAELEELEHQAMFLMDDINHIPPQ